MVTPAPAPSRAPNPAPPPQQTILGLIVSVAGSAVGAWIVDKLSSDPMFSLVGAIVGALVPALLSELLSRGRTRPAVALLVAAIAVALIYVTVTAKNVATHSPATFPVPPGVPVATTNTTPLPDPSPQAASSDTPSPATRSPSRPPDGERTGEAVPADVYCTVDGCSDPVTLRNLGDDAIAVTRIQIVPNTGSFTVSGACVQQTLEPGDECSLEVSYDPAAPSEAARLVIHQDLPGPPWYVDLHGEGPQTATDPSTPTTSSSPPQTAGPAGSTTATP